MLDRAGAGLPEAGWAWPAWLPEFAPNSDVARCRSLRMYGRSGLNNRCIGRILVGPDVGAPTSSIRTGASDGDTRGRVVVTPAH